LKVVLTIPGGRRPVLFHTSVLYWKFGPGLLLSLETMETTLTYLKHIVENTLTPAN